MREGRMPELRLDIELIPDILFLAIKKSSMKSRVVPAFTEVLNGYNGEKQICVVVFAKPEDIKVFCLEKDVSLELIDYKSMCFDDIRNLIKKSKSFNAIVFVSRGGNKYYHYIPKDDSELL